MNALCKTNQELDSSMTLGNLLYYSLSDILISDTDLKSIFQKNNIPSQYINPISRPDAFRRASSCAKQKIDLQDNSGNICKAKIEIDEIKSDENGIVRILGRKLIDETNQEVDYQQVAEIIFNRKIGDVTYRFLYTDYANNMTKYEAVCKQIVSNYNDWCIYHTKDTIRNLVNRIVNDTHPVALMPSGLCKFVPNIHTDLLHSLKEVVQELSHYATDLTAINYMEIIPVINTEEQQSMIKNASTKEIKEEMFDFISELKNVLTQKQSLSVRTATAYINKFKTLKSKVDDYENLLGEYLGAMKLQIVESLKLIEDNSSEEDDYDTTPTYI